MILDIEDLESDNPYFIPRKYRSPMTYIVKNILSELNGYNDYVATLTLEEGQVISLHEAIERSWCLEYLAQNKIIKYVENDNGDTVYVINRYKLELLSLVLEDKKENIEQLPNLIFYQLATGRGFVNGHPITLKKLNKRLFDALCMAAPEPVSRKQLRKVIRTGKGKNNASAYDISEAFSNLRKSCKVNAEVIALRDSGSLNAQVFTLEADFFNSDFSTE